MAEAEVVIVGAGIAGPALAAALAPHDVPVVLIERSTDPPDTARGDHLQPRTVEILDGWGALDTLRDREAEMRAGTVWRANDGELLLESRVTDLAVPHPYFLFLDHERIHGALLAAAARNPAFTFHRGVAGWEIRERGADGAVVEVDLGTETLVIEATVIVGADGQGSRVRRLVGIDASTHRYSRPISVFFASWTTEPEGKVLEGRIGAGGIVALVPRSGSVCKIGVATDAAELASWRAAEPDEIVGRLAAVAGDLPIAAPQHIGTYPPVRLVADRWVDGCAVLLGDACHAMHPAQSQGMNVAIRCADALARSLVERRGSAGEALAAYEASIRPTIEPVLQANHRAGTVFDSTDPGVLGGFTAMLRGVAADPDASHAYTLASAGYPPPVGT